MKRGILSTIYLRPKGKVNAQLLKDCLLQAYGDESFIRIVDEPPKTKDVYGSNRCHIFVAFDERSELIVMISVIDNLLKGAAGQALQNFNLMFSLPEGQVIENLVTWP